ncbi:MAG: hypothetical protein JOY90_18470 [Bradyrhizobium sp.]|uniref:hypothetical protein n=1 Tax=Bradyrhizobium sp. TaxID=376 RepID=UPI001E09C64F|nr:hypothetical protein [Bradyrhizobium sp.]MBV9562406.1 hypothetical protein [Bradyrhizobium sp.]
MLAEADATSAIADTTASWRADIDALSFPVVSHAACCVVHRRAFRTLLRFEPTPADCLRYFGECERAFRLAARAKIARRNIAAGTNLHLTSRDIARSLTA